MLVKATATGFYAGKRFREGQVFEVEKGSKSKWFESLEGEKKTRGTKQAVEPVEVEAPAVEEAPVEEATETVSE
jgi:ssDNA-binding replication factor A large subunit